MLLENNIVRNYEDEVMLYTIFLGYIIQSVMKILYNIQ